MTLAACVPERCARLMPYPAVLGGEWTTLERACGADLVDGGCTCPIHGPVACEACGEPSSELTPVTDHGVTLHCCEGCK